MVALDEPGVGEEVLDPWESFDVVDLIEDRQRQDLANAGHRAQSVKGLRVVLLGAAHEVELELMDDFVVVTDDFEINLETLADVGISGG